MPVARAATIPSVLVVLMCWVPTTSVTISSLASRRHRHALGVLPSRRCPNTDNCARCVQEEGCGWCATADGGGKCTHGTEYESGDAGAQCTCWKYDVCLNAKSPCKGQELEKPTREQYGLRSAIYEKDKKYASDVVKQYEDAIEDAQAKVTLWELESNGCKQTLKLLQEDLEAAQTQLETSKAEAETAQAEADRTLQAYRQVALEAENAISDKAEKMQEAQAASQSHALRDKQAKDLARAHDGLKGEIKMKNEKIDGQKKKCDAQDKASARVKAMEQRLSVDVRLRRAVVSARGRDIDTVAEFTKAVPLSSKQSSAGDTGDFHPSEHITDMP